jgi:hypothetical protein
MVLLILKRDPATYTKPSPCWDGCSHSGQRKMAPSNRGLGAIVFHLLGAKVPGGSQRPLAAARVAPLPSDSVGVK